MTGVRLAGDDEVVRDKDWLRAAQSARRLAWASMAGMSVEGAIGLWQGLATGSIALTGWALGSGVEGLASGIVVWRFSRGRTLSEMAEQRAQLWVAVSFWVLAPYVVAESVRELQTGHHSEPTAIGIGLAAVALIAMPLLGSAKHRLGSRLGSAATAGEGTQNYICAAEAGAVLVGLSLIHAWRQGWWLDPVIGLGLAVVAVGEGIESWRSKDHD